MFSLIDKLNQFSYKQIQLMIVTISILVATQVQYIQHGWINPDSVLYLEAAKLFAVGDWKAGFAIFPWPFYSLTIALTHHLTSLNIHHAAQLLNVVYFAIATYAFTTIIEQCGGRQLQLIAGALIFLSAQYMIGGVLEMLMRDEGFWAFFLLSLVFIMRFYQHHQLKDALFWQTMIILAVLFRIEAMLYLVLLPLVLFVNNQSFKFNALLTIKAYSLQIFLAFALITIILNHPNLSTDMLGRLNEIFTTNLWHEFSQKIVLKSQVMSEQVLGEYLEEFALPGLILTFIYAIIVKSISSTGVVTFVLGLFGIKNSSALIEKSARHVLFATMLIATLNMGLIITKVFVLSGRYVLAISFVFMVFASFYLANLLENSIQKPNKKNTIFITILVIIMLLGFVKNLMPKKQGYNYMQDTVTWIQKNNVENKPVFYSERRARYYANQPFDSSWVDQWSSVEKFVSNKNFQHFSYLAIGYSKSKPSHELFIKNTLSNFQEIKRFYDVKRKKYMVIYKRNE